MVLRHLVIILFALTLTACTNFVIGEGEGLLDAAVESGATRHRIYVATTRAFSDDPEEYFSGNRSTQLTLAYVDVTVPPNHKPGQIERPKSGRTNPLKHFAVNEPTLLETPAYSNKTLIRAFPAARLAIAISWFSYMVTM